MLGGRGDDSLAGEAHADLLMGGSGRDILEGGDGDDVIYGDQVLAENHAALLSLQQTFLSSIDPANIDNPPTLESVDNNGFLRIEAEDMNLASDIYVREASGNASNDYLIRNWSSELGTANTTFTGPSGQYMVVVNYLDESDGQASAAFNINGTEIDSWQFNQDNNRFVTRTVATNVTLTRGDVIELTGLNEGGEETYFDYIDLISLDNLLLTTPVSAEVSPESLLSNSGFESGLENWSVYAGNVTASQSAYIGDGALSLQSAGANAGQNIDVVGGELYTLSSYANSSSDGWTGFGVSFMDENWQQLQVETLSVSNADWQLYERQLAAPTDARYANIWAYNGGNTGEFLLDELSLFAGESNASPAVTSSTANDSEQQSSNNLLNNGGFSANLNSWLIHSGSAQVTQSDAYSQYSLQLIEADSVVAQAVKASAGSTYQLKSAGKFTGDSWSGFGVDFFDVNWQKISTNTYEIIQNWRTYEHQVVAPEGTFYASVWGMKTGSNGKLLLDDLSFHEIATSTASAPSGQFQEDLVAHWTFDEAMGSGLGSAQGFQGTLQNMESEDWVAGVEGHSLNFDGSGESVQINDAQALRLGNNNVDFSVAFWLKPEAGPTGEFRTILNKWGSQGKIFGFWLDADSNRLKYSLSTLADANAGHFSQAEIALNQWTHVTYVKSGNQMALYLNGELDSSMVVQGVVQSPEGLIELGSGLEGSLDELRFYNRGLSLSEIQSLSNHNADVLKGGLGDDTLYGDLGDDILNGTHAALAGRNELDRLSGGIGRDLFILGDETQAYYGFSGSHDYATIADFEENSDSVQLHGSASDYTQQQQDSHSQLLYKNDLVAVFESVSSLNLTSSSFSFVG
ncbi:MAG: LamG-like jellyroll fold domain-containing protein [Cyanobacteria bacterium P01_C01_bin.121]